MNIRYRVTLSAEERCDLLEMVQGGKVAARRMKRAQILLAADLRSTDEQIARNVSVGTSTVYRTKQRFVDEGFEAALSEASRPGAPRKLDIEDEAIPHILLPDWGRELHIRACSIVLPRPRKLKHSLPESLSINLVQVTEENPPADVEPVEWLLFTTLPVGNAAQVATVIDTYRARWTIEEYFKALKSGCSYEKRQLESRHALLNALGILAPLAWRLLALRSVGDDPTTPASAVLEVDEIHVLRKLSHDIKLGDNPTASQALYAIALLGGHFPSNGRPGWKVIWTGFQKLLAQVEGYRLARDEM